MLKKLLTALAIVGVSMTAQATPITDVQDYSNNTATEYFVDVDGNKYNNPYYRDENEDWEWIHNAIAGGPFSSIILEISAFDVDSPDEMDEIFVWDGAAWFSVGNLVGLDDTWAFTSFDLTAYAWAAAQVNAGLRVRMDIDTGFDGWLVTLAKSTLSVNGGSQQCVPQPGVPCGPSNVPEPEGLVALALGLLFVRRFAKK